MPDRPHERFIAPARARPQLWRLVAGLGLVVAVHLLWTLALLGAVALLQGRGPLTPEGLGRTPDVMIVLLFTFAGLGIGTVLAARVFHGRSAGTLVGNGPTALRHFVWGAALILGLNLGALFILRTGLWIEPALAPRLWLALLPVALLAVLVQTGAEEALFRGYLQQQLAVRFRSALIWMLAPSIAFGLLHFEPSTMGPNVWPVVALTALFGLVAADLTARSGTLGLAWGLHFANNLFALLIVSPRGDLSGLALYHAPAANDAAMPGLLLVDAVVLLAIWAICRFALRRG